MTDWRASTLGDEIELAYGKALPAHSRTNGGVLVYGSNGVVGTHTGPLVDGPGIIVGRKGSVGAVVFSENGFWPIDTAYYVINKRGHNWRYLYYLLLSSGLTQLNSHSAVPGLNREDAYAISARIPPRHVQDDIARVLDFLDESVKVESESLARTRELKGAVTRDVFSHGLRPTESKESDIGPIPEHWDVVPLGSLGRVGNGSTPKRSNTDYWSGGNFPWLTSAKVYDREITEADQFVTAAALDECHLPVVEPGAVLVAITGQGKTLGHCAVLGVQATINQHIAYIQTDLTKAVPGFVRGYLETQYDYLRQVAAGGGSTKGALSCAFLRSLPVPLPELAEQREVVAVLDMLDAKSKLHGQKLAVLQKIRDSLVASLISGDIPVDDLNLSALTVKGT